MRSLSTSNRSCGFFQHIDLAADGYRVLETTLQHQDGERTVQAEASALQAATTATQTQTKALDARVQASKRLQRTCWHMHCLRALLHAFPCSCVLCQGAVSLQRFPPCRGSQAMLLLQALQLASQRALHNVNQKDNLLSSLQERHDAHEDVCGAGKWVMAR